jgi:teichuronic acid exporter
MSLKDKAINGAKWAVIDNFMNLGSSLIIGIILARLLTPEDYGLIGMIYVFIVLSTVFTSSGFGQSLIRTNDASQKDYSTVFVFNIIVCIVSYLILFSAAPYIAKFFNHPLLINVLRVMGLVVIINGFSLVQTAIRVKELNYKIQAQISIVGTLTGGIIAIIMAIKGFGVWSLVAQLLIKSFISTVLYWITSKWHPILIYSKEHFKKHWSFSVALLRMDITIVIFDNLYHLVIGKYYTAALLGQFSRAKAFTDLSSSSIYRVLSNGIAYPVLCKVKNNIDELKKLFQRFLRLIVFISSITTFFFVAVSDSFIPFVIGNQWILAIKFIKIISISTFLFPINTYNLSIAKVIGKPEILANAILLQRLLIIPAVITGIFTNVYVLVWGTAVTSLFSLFYNAYKVKHVLQIPLKEQFNTIIHVVSVPFICSVVIYAIWLISPGKNPGYILLVQLTVGIMLLIGLCEMIKQKEYLELKTIVLQELKKIVWWNYVKIKPQSP